jgi:glucokinase
VAVGTIGLEIVDSRIVAVLVADDGEIRQRAAVDIVGSGGDAAAAVREAIGQVGGNGKTPAGVAAFAPESPAVTAAVAALPAPATVVSSGTAAAVAECWIGAAKGVQDAVFFAVADHTTGGIVRGGVPVNGARGRAASVAWLALNPVEREDYRKVGCLEAEVAASGIVRRLVWRIKAGDRSSVEDAVNGDMTAIKIDHALAAARTGDGVAISVIRDTAKYLGMAAANLVVLADPEALVVGGLMASAADLLMEPLRNEITRRLPRAMLDALTIAPAALGADAAAIGAARLAARR